jgi:hypothetical protein
MQGSVGAEKEYNGGRAGEFCRYSWAECLSGLRSGWPEGVRDVDVATDRICADQHDASAVSIGYDVTGDYIDVGAFLQGEPECWGVFAEEHRPQEEIRIVVNICFSGRVPQEHIIYRGAAITSLIDRLSRNYFIKLQFVCRTSDTGEKAGSGDGYHTTINVDMRNGYSRDLIAFMSAHPGMLRRVWFVAAEREFNHADLGGYGYVKDVPEDERGDIYFPANQGMASIEAAREHVQGIIDNLQRKKGG